MKGLAFTIKEQTRLQILNTVLERRWYIRETAEVLGAGHRHVHTDSAYAQQLKGEGNV
jgi:hypothetical protein